MDKTNAARILDRAKIKYEIHEYDPEETDGEKVAELTGHDPNQTFKTLVTVGSDKINRVFVVPVNRNLNLKKAAKVAGVKSIEMIKQKELLPLTGYVHGGCSPLGMKKQFATYFHSSCIDFDKIMFSAGKRGMQIETSAQDVIELIHANIADIAE